MRNFSDFSKEDVEEDIDDVRKNTKELKKQDFSTPDNKRKRPHSVYKNSDVSGEK